MRKVFLALISVTIANFVYGGTVKELTGSVDVLLKDKWVPAKIGMEIATDTKIMTGVSSSVKVDTKGGYFEVKELSMATFHEAATDNSVDQKIALRVGKVKVRFSKIGGIQSSFKVQTPKGTASVRGTEEEVSYFPSAGMGVDVLEGSIDVVDNTGSGVTTGEGQSSGVGQNGSLHTDSDNLQNNFGGGDHFNDNDSENVGDNLGNSIDDLLNDQFDEGSGTTPEPERL